MRLTLRQIHYVEAVAKLGSIASAARDCAISQSSILAAINFAENKMGARLFDRRPGQGVRLTPAGERFIGSARALMSAEAEFERRMGNLAKGCPPVLKIGCFEPFGALFMPALLKQYLQDRDGEFALFEGEQPQLLEWLQTGKVDFIMTYDIGADVPKDATPLAMFPAHALLNIADPLASKKIVSLAELAARPLVLLDLPLTSAYLTALIDTASSKPNVVFRTRSYSTVRAAVASGFGASILNMPPIGKGSPDSPSLVRVPLAGDLPTPTLIVADIYGNQKPQFVLDFLTAARVFFQQIGPRNFAVAQAGRYSDLLPEV